MTHLKSSFFRTDLASPENVKVSRRSVLGASVALGVPVVAANTFTGTMLAASQSDAAVIEEEVVLAMPSEPATLDPHKIRGNEEWNVLNHIYEPLIGRTPDGETLPGLLESWEPVDDEQKTWRLRLREGVTFHNGEPWTAEVLKFNFERQRTNETVTTQQYVNGVDSEEVIDDLTLEISISVPMALLENGFIQFSIVPMQYTQDAGEDELGENPVGTGPYRFVEWRKDEHIRLEAYPDYWGELPSVRQGLIRAIPEAPTRVAALVSGEVDVIRGVSVYDIERIEQNDNTQMQSRPGPRMWNLKMDTARETDSPGIEGENPFVHREVREAVYRAIDVSELIDAALMGQAEPASQLSAPFIYGHNPELERLSYDPDLAMQLLEEAGYGDGFTVRLDVESGQAIIAEVIAGFLSEVGITVEVNAVATSVYTDITTNHETSFALGSWGATLVNTAFDANIHSVDAERGYGRANYGQYSHSEIDEGIEQASSEFNRDAQEQAYQELQALAMEDIAIVPLYFESILVASSIELIVVPRYNEWVMLQDITLASS